MLPLHTGESKDFRACGREIWARERKGGRGVREWKILGERETNRERERESVAPFVSVQHETGERAPGGRACVCVCVCVYACVS